MRTRRQSRGRISGKNIVLSVLLIFSLVTATGCATFNNFSETFLGKETVEDTIRIGVFQPLSGSDKEASSLELMGIELAHKLYPRVLGKEVELIYADNKSEIASAESAARQLAEKKVDIVLGSYGNTLSMAGSAWFQEGEIPAIAITCTNPLVTRGNSYYFRISIVDSFQGTMAAKYVYDEELGLPKTVIMKQAEDDYGAALSQQFVDELSSLTEEKDPVEAIIEYKSDTADYEKELARIKSLDAEIVYLPCSAEEGAEIIKQAKVHNIDAVFIGTDLWHEDVFIEEGGGAVEGAIFTTYFDAESAATEKTQEFLSAYRAEYGEDKVPDSATALGFDAYLLALDAMERQASHDAAGVGNLTLRDVLAGTREYAGVTGSITFDENGDPIKPVVLITVEDGVFVYKDTVEPEWG